MKYNCLSQQIFREKEYSLIPIRQEDMPSIRQWRNQQIAILRQNSMLSQEAQTNYWHHVLKPGFSEQRPKQLLFSFLKEKQCIGYGGLTQINWTARNGELSFLLEPSRTEDKARYQNEFSVFISLIKLLAFNELRFHRLFTETYDVRPEHVEVLETLGFRLEGVLKDHVMIKGRYHDSLIHGLLIPEAEPSKL